MADAEPDADAVDRKRERAVRFANAYIDEHYELFETLAQADPDTLTENEKMPDSPTSEADTPSREPRFAAVVRWAEYIQDNPPEVWGPQQNAVVNAQIDSAAAVERTPEDIERIRAFADDVLDDE